MFNSPIENNPIVKLDLDQPNTTEDHKKLLNRRKIHLTSGWTRVWFTTEYSFTTWFELIGRFFENFRNFPPPFLNGLITIGERGSIRMILTRSIKVNRDENR